VYTIRKEMPPRRKPRTRTPKKKNNPSKPKRGNASKTTGTPRQGKKSNKGDGPDRRKNAKDKADASKNNTAAWAAMGIGAAAAAAITAKALASYASSDGANITFTDIQPQKYGLWSTKLEISWKFKDNPENPVAIANEVRVIKGDEIDIRGIPEIKGIDGKTATVTEIKDDYTFIIESKMSYSEIKDISIQNKGEGTIHTSFDDHLDQTVDDTVGSISSTLGLDKIWSYMGLIAGIFLGCICVYFLFKFYQSYKSGSAAPVAAHA
jgi:hypothetical protein